MTKILSFTAIALALTTQLHAQTNKPVRLSINGSATVALQPDGSTASDDTQRSIAYFSTDIASNSNRRVMQLRVADPVLCADFVASEPASQVRLRVLDSNGLIQGSDTRGFRGLTPYDSGNDSGGVRYRLDPTDSTRRILNISTSNSLRCAVFPGGVTAGINKNAKGGDLIFSDGFESPLANGVDLETTLLGVPTGARGGDAVTYTIRVTNLGGTTASNVQVRDYFPLPQSGSAQPGLSGSWSCSGSAGAGCSAASGNSYVFLPNATIPGGGRVDIQITRTLSNATAPTIGATFRVQAAAFSDPNQAEAALANNAASSSLITVVSNSAPVISSVANQTIGEDSSTSALAFTVSDPDGPAGPNVTATSSNTAVVANSGVVIGGAGTNRTVTVTPLANAFGSTTITISASDTVSVGTTTFTVTVNPINDAPSFTFSSGCPSSPGGATFTAAAGSNPDTITFNSLSAQALYSCANAIVFNPGPGESDTLTNVSGLVIENLAGSNVLNTGFSSAVAQGGNVVVNLALNGATGQAEMRFAVSDSGSPALTSSVRTLRIRVPSVAPTISAIGPQSTNEDTTTSAISFTVGDSDTALSALQVTVTSSNTALMASPGVMASSSNATRSFTLSPQSNANGTSTITVAVTDGDQTVTSSFTLTVNAINDQPTFASPVTIALPAGSALSQDLAYASAMAPGGGPDEAGQSLNWLSVQLGSTASGAPSTGDILGAPFVAPSVLTNAAPNNDTANIVFDLRDAGGGQPATGHICLRTRLRDNGAPAAATTIRPVCIVVGATSCPVTCN